LFPKSSLFVFPKDVETRSEDKPDSETDDGHNYAVPQCIIILKKSPLIASLAVCMAVLNM
jgi:hypothetical protein